MKRWLLRDITTGLVKSMVFGIVITAVGCYEGFSTGAGAEEVGRSTTSAVVISIFLVVLIDLLSPISSTRRGQAYECSPRSRTPVISMRGLRVSYGEREVLHGIDFEVMQGET